MRPILTALAAACALAALAALPAAAQAAVSFQPPGDVVEELAADITITGTTAASGRRVWALWQHGEVACPPTYTATGPAAWPLEIADRNVSGTWTKTAKFTASVAGTYTLCAWVGPDIGVADEVARQVVHARRGTATITFGLPADPTAEVPQQLVVQGTSELNRDLHVAVLGGDVACPAEPPDDRHLVNGRKVNGAFSSTEELRRNTPGTATICGWVKDFFEATPNGTARATVTFRAPRATVSVTGPATYTTRQDGVVFTATGTTEAPRQVWMILADGDGCAPTARGQAGSWAVVGSSLGRGPFTRATGPQGNVGRHTVCVYVGTETSTDALAEHRYTVTLDPRDDENAGAERPVTVPPPALTAPLDGLRGKGARPTFRWAQEPWHGEDTLVIAARDTGGKLTRLVDVGEVDAVVHRGKKRLKAKTDTIARGSYDGFQRTVRLKQPLPAGDYVWWVDRRELSTEDVAPMRSAQRVLTVEGAKLAGRLQVSKRTVRQSFRQAPGVTFLTARTAPQAKVRFTVRQGGRSRTFTEIADRDGYALQRVFWSCDQPGARYQIVVRAADQYGATRTKRLTARGPSRARCARLDRGDVKGYLRRERRKALKKLTPKCAARGGVAAEVQEVNNAYVACLSPAGGTITIR